jgi:hypothetical protein
MPFASHAMMLHPFTTKTFQTHFTMPDSVDCTMHQHMTGDPQHQQKDTTQQNCKCMTTGCYNSALLSSANNSFSTCAENILFQLIDNNIRSAHTTRLERPPRL